MRLPVPGKPRESHLHRKLMRAHPFEHWLLGLVSFKQKSKAPLTLYQLSLVEFADRLNIEARANVPSLAGKILHEHEAAIHIHQSLKRFMKRK